MTSINKRGQGLLIIAILLVLLVLVVALIYREFTMTPAYIYQRSVYYALKYDPQVIVEQLIQVMNAVVTGYAINYSQFLMNEGITLYLHALTSMPVSYSLSNVIESQLKLMINSIYTPTGLIVPENNLNASIAAVTGFYGALGIPGIKYVYSGENSSLILASAQQTYDLPSLGIQHLTLNYSINLTASTAPNGICNISPNTMTYNTTLECIFNFKTNTYTCNGPGIYSTGQANSLWAPSYQAYPSQEYYQSDVGWVVSTGTYPLVFVYPVDELMGQNGFVISATFNVTQSQSNYLVGINFLTPTPPTSGTGNNGYTICVIPSSQPSNNQYKCTVSSTASSTIINVTVIVTPNEPINLIGGSVTGTASIYINGKTIGSPITVYLPNFHLIPNTLFGNNAYMLSGYDSNSKVYVGSWVALILSNAAVVNASIKYFNSYTLPTNIPIEVSINNKPALGTTLSGLTVTPTLGALSFSINYTVCNITNNAIVFNVQMPWPPTGYPTTQYLVLINYSNIILALNPWANPQNSVIPQGYSATSLLPYMSYVLNESGNELIVNTYFINLGVPTLLSIYGSNTGLYITNIINRYDYAAMGTVIPIPSLNILKVNNVFPMHVMPIFTFNETLYNLAAGYTVISQVVPPTQTEITGYGSTNNYPSGLYNWVTEYEHFPNQTLPYTYFNYTILNCWGTTQSNNEYVNYNLYYIYANGQLQYNGYTPSQYLPSCQGSYW
ncbi:hypothetical protein [Vulcanisaeta souniana]|nr:hypothetical protein [Vulcanisaeta souniana]GGI79037.1 hypothetical protein GCM10007112_14990 [Vulcanisaeta souniana JCM 11219]